MTSTNTPAGITPAGPVPNAPGVYLDSSGGYWVHHFHYRWQLVAQVDPERETEIMRIDSQGNLSAGDLVALDHVLTWRDENTIESMFSHLFPLTFLGDIIDPRKDENA